MSVHRVLDADALLFSQSVLATLHITLFTYLVYEQMILHFGDLPGIDIMPRYFSHILTFYSEPNTVLQRGCGKPIVSHELEIELNFIPKDATTCHRELPLFE